MDHFPVVREAALQIREVEPVDASEVKVLATTALPGHPQCHRPPHPATPAIGASWLLVDLPGRNCPYRRRGRQGAGAAVQLLRQLHDFGMSAVLVPLCRA